MGTPSDHVNQRLANLIINKQLPAWDKKELRMYKKMYPTSKAWLFLESDFPVPQPHRMSRYRGNRPAVTPVNLTVPSLDRSFTPDPTNALGSTPLTEAPLAQIPPVQAPSMPPHPIQVPKAQILPILSTVFTS